MQVVLIHLRLVTLLFTMIVLASDSDIPIFSQCNIIIVHVSASSLIVRNSLASLQERWNISSSITWDRFLSTSLSSILVSCTLIQDYDND